MRISFLVLLFSIGCGSSSTESITVTSITPAFGPLAGGTRVVITGTGFLGFGAAPNRVVFGGNEAPLAAAATDTTLEVVVPPSTMPGPVDVLAFNQNGSTTVMGQFHYSTPPTITGISPNGVLFSAASTQITVTGTGFKDENAGLVKLTLDGAPAIDVTVVSDTQITFTAVGGQPMVRPDVQLSNTRGEVKAAGFRYIPSTNAGLIVFGNGTQGSTTMGAFYDPVNNVQVSFPQKNTAAAHVHSTFVDANGDYWGAVGGQTLPWQFGKLDFRTAATVRSPVSVNAKLAALASVGTDIFAYDRQTGSFGKLDKETGQFTRIAAETNTCCHSLFVHSNVVSYTLGSNQLTTINTTNGTLGTIVTLAPARQFSEMRYLGNTLYGVDTVGNLVTINPSTGVVSAVVHAFNIGNVSAMEVFQP